MDYREDVGNRKLAHDEISQSFESVAKNLSMQRQFVVQAGQLGQVRVVDVNMFDVVLYDLNKVCVALNLFGPICGAEKEIKVIDPSAMGDSLYPSIPVRFHQSVIWHGEVE